jgi:hypothetical protein
MAPIAGTLQCTYYVMLRKCLEVVYGELQLLTDESVYGDLMRGSVEVRNRAMVSIVALFRNETMPPISKLSSNIHIS